MAGRGRKDMASTIPHSVRERVTSEEAGTAAKRVPRVPPIASASTDPELANRFADFLITDIQDHPDEYPKSVADLGRAAKVSATYVRFQVAKPDLIARVRAETGMTMESDGATVTLDGTPVAPRTPSGEGVTVKKDGARPDTWRVRPMSSSTDSTVDHDPNFFHYPPGFKERVRAILAADLNLWFYGETGTGKSEGFERICEEDSRKVVKASCNGESSVDDVLGHFILRGTETVWVDGALPLAMKTGAVLICEEVDAAPAEINLALQRALEVRVGRKRHFLNPRNGEEVEAQPGFLIAATANTSGGGDYSGIYAGTQTQNAAFRDRFVFIQVTYPDEPSEIKILQHRVKDFPFTIAQKAVRLANYARNAMKNGQTFTPVSTRSLLGFAQLYMAFTTGGIGERTSLRDALNATIFHKAASPSDSKALSEMAQKLFGTF
jgi:MoxR-like ATPase